MRAELLYNLKVGVNLMLKDTAWLTERKRLSAKVVLEKVRRGVCVGSYPYIYSQTICIR